jgi:hypothetical protein
MVKRKRETAAEVMERLKNDKEFQARKLKKEQEMEIAYAPIHKDDEGIVKELNQAGIKVKSVWDFVNTKDKYPDAIDILGKHLSLSHTNRIKDGIARSLAVPYAVKFFDVLVSEYRKATPDEEIAIPVDRGYKEGLAVALSVQANNKERLDKLFELLKDKKQGSSRCMLLFAIDYYFKKDEEVKNRLRELNDTELNEFVKNNFKWKL